MMPRRTLAQKTETTWQCLACVCVHYSLVEENGMGEENKGQVFSEENKLHLVMKGEMWGSL